MSGVFLDNLLTSIPGNLFANNTNLKSLSMMFYSNPLNGTGIPDNLYAMLSLIEQLNSNFSYSNILTIPEGLYANCPVLKNVSNDFSYCPNLQSIPNLLFENNKQIVDFSSTFINCLSLQGTTPKGTDNLELWERAGQPGYPSTIYGQYYFAYDVQLSTYASMPNNWKN
jgi:hypothetical protein